MTEEYKNIRSALQIQESRLEEIKKRREQAVHIADEQTGEKMVRIKERQETVRTRIAKVNAYLTMAESKNCVHIEPQQEKEFNNAALAQMAVQINGIAGAECAATLYTEAKAQRMALEREALACEEELRMLSGQTGAASPSGKDFSGEIMALKSSVEAFFRSEEFVGFRREVIDTVGMFTGKERLAGKRSALAIGSIPLDLFTAGAGEALFADWYREDFSYGRDRAVPLSFDMTKGQIFLAEFEPLNEAAVIAGIQNALYNFLLHRKFPTKQVLMIDPVRNNDTALGPLSEICGMPGSPVSHVPKEPMQIRQAVGSLLEAVKAEEKSGAYREESGDYADRVVVFHDFPVGYDSEQIRWIQELCVSAAHYRMIVFLTFNKSAEANKAVREAVHMIRGYATCIYADENRFYVKGVTEKDTEFVWYAAPPALKEEEIASFIREEEEKELDNRYDRRMNIGELPKYVKGKRRLDRIYYGLDEEGTLQSLDFEDANFACYLCGASRSGKSTFLHTLIASILASTHPDDVEIWLIDFKKTEFSRYLDHMPPHIRYVVLDESPELVYDIIDRLTEILRKRQNRFMGKWEKLGDVPKNQYMPEIFVIIDEFSRMSQVLTDTVLSARGDYTVKLQNLLTAGAAFGFKFIFSSQDFSEGTRGLTSTAKKQIQQRIAMYCKTPGEIKETLGLVHASERDTRMMENLPVHHTLMRIPEDADGNHLKLTKPLYFQDKKAEFDLIDKVCQALHPVKKYSVEDAGGYIYKEPLMIDGNSYTLFSEKRELLQKEIDSGQEEGETRIALGEPKRLLPVHLAAVWDSYGENAIMITPVNESDCGAAVVYTAAASLKMQGRRVHLWGYTRSGVYRRILAGENPFENPVCDLTELCGKIRALREKIEKKISGSDFIFLTGIDSYMADMAFLPPKSGGDRKKSDAGKRQEAAEDMPFYEARAEGEMDLESRMRMAMSGTQGSAPVQDGAKPAREKEESRSVDKSSEPTGEALPAHGEEAALPKREDGESAEWDCGEEYDAREDLKFIFTQGPRYGYHFFAIFTAWQEVKQSKLKPDDFKHRILFKMPKSEALELMSTANAGVVETLDEHNFRYANGIEALSFRPYVHEGLSWSGMGAGEDEEDEEAESLLE